MTNEDKRELRALAKQGYTVKEIQGIVNCSLSTIRMYVKVFGNNSKIVSKEPTND
ncbi:MAG: hypothetical protein HC880_00855 [Bacteroidia bacterium]|nr:hypothetical protein [Bacteroidia bacterium]